jgi:hypothetical protein
MSPGIRGDEHSSMGDLDQTIRGDFNLDGLATQPPAHVIPVGGQTDPTR